MPLLKNFFNQTSYQYGPHLQAYLCQEDNQWILTQELSHADFSHYFLRGKIFCEISAAAALVLALPLIRAIIEESPLYFFIMLNISHHTAALIDSDYGQYLLSSQSLSINVLCHISADLSQKLLTGQVALKDLTLLMDCNRYAYQALQHPFILSLDAEPSVNLLTLRTFRKMTLKQYQIFCSLLSNPHSKKILFELMNQPKGNEILDIIFSIQKQCGKYTFKNSFGLIENSDHSDLTEKAVYWFLNNTLIQNMVLSKYLHTEPLEIKHDLAERFDNSANAFILVLKFKHFEFQEKDKVWRKLIAYKLQTSAYRNALINFKNPMPLFGTTFLANPIVQRLLAQDENFLPIILSNYSKLVNPLVIEALEILLDNNLFDDRHFYPADLSLLFSITGREEVNALRDPDVQAHLRVTSHRLAAILFRAKLIAAIDSYNQALPAPRTRFYFLTHKDTYQPSRKTMTSLKNYLQNGSDSYWKKHRASFSPVPESLNTALRRHNLDAPAFLSYLSQAEPDQLWEQLTAAPTRPGSMHHLNAAPTIALGHIDLEEMAASDPLPLIEKARIISSLEVKDSLVVLAENFRHCNLTDLLDCNAFAQEALLNPLFASLLINSIFDLVNHPVFRKMTAKQYALLQALLTDSVSKEFLTASTLWHCGNQILENIFSIQQQCELYIAQRGYHDAHEESILLSKKAINWFLSQPFIQRMIESMHIHIDPIEIKISLEGILLNDNTPTALIHCIENNPDALMRKNNVWQLLMEQSLDTPLNYTVLADFTPIIHDVAVNTLQNPEITALIRANPTVLQQILMISTNFQKMNLLTPVSQRYCKANVKNIDVILALTTGAQYQIISHPIIEILFINAPASLNFIAAMMTHVNITGFALFALDILRINSLLDVNDKESIGAILKITRQEEVNLLLCPQTQLFLKNKPNCLPHLLMRLSLIPALDLYLQSRLVYSTEQGYTLEQCLQHEKIAVAVISLKNYLLGQPSTDWIEHVNCFASHTFRVLFAKHGLGWQTVYDYFKNPEKYTLFNQLPLYSGPLVTTPIIATRQLHDSSPLALATRAYPNDYPSAQVACIDSNHESLPPLATATFIRACSILTPTTTPHLACERRKTPMHKH